MGRPLEIHPPKRKIKKKKMIKLHTLQFEIKQFIKIPNRTYRERNLKIRRNTELHMKFKNDDSILAINSAIV